MQETSEEKVNETAASEQSSQKTKQGLIAGLVLATGALLVIGARIKSKIDLANVRQRLLHGKSLPLDSSEQASVSDNPGLQDGERPVPTEEPASTPDELDAQEEK